MTIWRQIIRIVAGAPPAAYRSTCSAPTKANRYLGSSMSWQPSSAERPIVWLDSALEICRGFPSHIRGRIGCELVTVRRWGLGRTWEGLRGVSGAASFTVRDSANRAAPKFYRIVSATSMPDAFVVIHALVRAYVRGVAGIPQKDVGFSRARLLDVALDRQERGSVEGTRVRRQIAVENVFLQLGFETHEAVDLMLRAELIAELRHTLRRRAEDGHSNGSTRAIVDGDIGSVSVEALTGIVDRIRAASQT